MRYEKNNYFMQRITNGFCFSDMKTRRKNREELKLFVSDSMMVRCTIHMQLITIINGYYLYIIIVVYQDDSAFHQTFQIKIV